MPSGFCASFAENKSVRFKPRMCWKTFLRIRSIWNRNRRCKKARSEVFTPPFTDPFNTPGAPPKPAIGRKPSGFFCSPPGFTCSHSFVPPVATGIFYFSVAFFGSPVISAPAVCATPLLPFRLNFRAPLFCSEGFFGMALPRLESIRGSQQQCRTKRKTKVYPLPF